MFFYTFGGRALPMSLVKPKTRRNSPRRHNHRHLPQTLERQTLRQNTNRGNSKIKPLGIRPQRNKLSRLRTHRPRIRIRLRRSNIWNDLTYNFDKQTWKSHPENSADNIVKRSKNNFTELIQNTYRVLLSRGMKGCYIYFTDKNTERFFKSRIEKI
jgi:hypothetical protein